MKTLKVILAAAIIAATGSALATPTLTISDGVTTASLTDASGDVFYQNTSFDSAWSLVIVTGETKPLSGFGSATSPKLELNVQASSLSFSPARDLTITFSDNFYGPTLGGTFRADLTGHVVNGTGQNATYSTFFDAANVTSATTSQLTTTGSLAPPTYGPNTQFSSGLFNQTLYSLTQVITIKGTDAASAAGQYTFDATLTLVPEPGSCALLLAGAGVFGLWRRRQ